MWWIATAMAAPRFEIPASESVEGWRAAWQSVVDTQGEPARAVDVVQLQAAGAVWQVHVVTQGKASAVARVAPALTPEARVEVCYLVWAASRPPVVSLDDLVVPSAAVSSPLPASSPAPAARAPAPVPPAPVAPVSPPPTDTEASVRDDVPDPSWGLTPRVLDVGVGVGSHWGAERLTVSPTAAVWLHAAERFGPLDLGVHLEGALGAYRYVYTGHDAWMNGERWRGTVSGTAGTCAGAFRVTVMGGARFVSAVGLNWPVQPVSALQLQVAPQRTRWSLWTRLDYVLSGALVGPTEDSIARAESFLAVDGPYPGGRVGPLIASGGVSVSLRSLR